MYQQLVLCLRWRRRRTWRHDRQRKHKVEIVIGGDAVEPFEAAGKAALHQHVFAVGPLECAGRLHQAPAGARAVARDGGIYMQRVEAVGTVVPMVAAAWEWPDRAVTMSTDKALLLRARPRWALLCCG